MHRMTPDLGYFKVKVAHLYSGGTPEYHISPRFTLRSLVFQMVEVFCFPIYYGSVFEVFEKKSA